MISLRLPPEMLEVMERVRNQDPELGFTSQIERALRDWLKAKGVEPSDGAERKRAVTRQRS